MNYKPSSSIIATSGSNMTNFMLTTIAAALVAGISAYCVSSWKTKEKIKRDNQSVLLEQLTEIRKRLSDLECSKKKTRRPSRSSLSFRTDESEYFYTESLLCSFHLI
jgi:uncharacterized protein YlxW (UPF0749 family)